MHFAWLAVFSSCLLAQPGTSQPQKPDQAVAAGNSRIVQATRVEVAPKLDGTLDDPLWQLAKPITNFLQREPYEGQPPTERTEVRVLYTKYSVYFGITCFDTDPRKIVATELRRDVSQHLDDCFEIVIDSAHDRRNAYVFQITPLGTQRDALITEEQQGDSDDDGDSCCDGIWTSETRINQRGWTATVAIPFSTLHFMKSDDVVWASTSSASSAARTRRTCGRAGAGWMARRALARRVSCTVFQTSAAEGSLS